MNDTCLRIKANLTRIITGIQEVTENYREIGIVGVTKTRSIDEIEAALSAGLSIIGENRFQEAEEKIPQLAGKYREFHFIGHLQRNKVKKLMELKPSLIHSIDSLQTAEKIDNYCQANKITQDILVQVNCSGEESKFGLADDYSVLKDFLNKLSKLTYVNVKGLMTLAAYTDVEAQIRESFTKLREYFEEANRQSLTSQPMTILSMGMSNDYLIAVKEGANLLRIGSAIFE